MPPRRLSVESSATGAGTSGFNMMKLYPNMDELPELSVDVVLDNLERLFFQEQCSEPGEDKVNKIYSTVGPLLIAMNPFENLPCFSQKWKDVFKNEGKSGRIDQSWRTLGPHCYLTVEQAYQGLKTSQHQSVVICGESGAGKTVTNRLMLEYILGGSGDEDNRPKTMGERGSQRSSKSSFGSSQNGGTKDGEKRSVEFSLPHDSSKASAASDGGGRKVDFAQLKRSSDLLESFGNAKTGRNDNSSRFGKYSRLYFVGDKLVIHGLDVEHYLLERSRVAQVPQGERNYHILHQLACHEPGGQPAFEYIKDAADEVKGTGDSFHDEEDHEELKEFMSAASFGDELSKNIFDSIKAVLYLGNIKFVGDKESCKVDPKTKKHLETVCKFLGVDVDKLSAAMCKKVVTVPDGDIETDVGVAEAVFQRDAIAKMLYSRIFDWIIRIINAKLRTTEKPSAKTSSLGLLDIFGFEDMPVNGFEQMFINLTNEAIQHLFNAIMFERELQTYKEEGIDINFEIPASNWGCVDLFISEKMPGIVRLIADRANQRGASDGQAFVETVLNRRLSKHPDYEVCEPTGLRKVVQSKKQKWLIDIDIHYKECFTVKHYAGDVVYTVREFLSKSKDSVHDHILEVLGSSPKTHVQALFDNTGGQKKNQTVGQKFTKQLQGLRDELGAHGCVFVRCIKPNGKGHQGTLDRELVLEQLKCSGVVSALDMRRNGLPERLQYKEFVTEFFPLEAGSREEIQERAQNISDQRRVNDILKEFIGKDSERYVFGATKVFMKSGVLSYLRDILWFHSKRAASVVQRQWRIRAGSTVMTNISNLRSRMTKAQETAEGAGLGRVMSVRKSIQEAQDDEGWKNWVKAEEEQRNLMQTDRKKAMVELSKVLKKADLARMMSSIQFLEEGVQGTMKKQGLVRVRVQALVTERIIECNRMRQRVREVEAICGSTDGEQADCGEACRKANERLQALVSEEFRKLQVETCASMDLDKLPTKLTKITLPPRAKEMVDEGEVLVAACEESAKELIEKRRRFQFEALKARPELQELLANRDEARLRLEAISNRDPEQFGSDELDFVVKSIQQGLDGVATAIEDALRWDSLAEDLQRSATDPDRFIEALRKFVESEETAQQVLTRAKQLAQDLRERERTLYSDLLTSYEEHSELRDVGVRFGRMLQGLGRSLDEVMGADGEPMLGELGTRIKGRVEAAEAAVTELDLQRAPPVPGKLMFVYQGAWSAECFSLLGKEYDVVATQAKVLDGCTSVLGAVEVLNAGVATAEDGFCVGWSDLWDSYFLLYQNEKRERAFEAVPHKPLFAKRKGDRFREAIANALSSADREKWQEAIAQKQSEMEKRVREAAEAPLKQNLMEVEKSMAEVKKHATQAEKQIAELKGRKIQAQQQIKELEANRTEADQQISELRSKQALAQQNISDLQGGKSQAEQQVTELRGQNKEADQQIVELEERKSQAERQISELENQQTQAGEQIGELQEQKANADQQITELRGDKAQAEQEVSTLKGQKTRADKSISELTRAQQELKQTLQQVMGKPHQAPDGPVYQLASLNFLPKTNEEPFPALVARVKDAVAQSRLKIITVETVAVSDAVASISPTRVGNFIRVWYNAMEPDNQTDEVQKMLENQKATEPPLQWREAENGCCVIS